MAKRGNPRPTQPLPPAPRAGQSTNTSSFGGYRRPDLADYQRHAEEIKAVARGADIVEPDPESRDERPPPFKRRELEVVRSWVKSRPLEPSPAAAAKVAYPRQWNSKRGRYCKFSLPGAGAYALLRARPTF